MLATRPVTAAVTYQASSYAQKSALGAAFPAALSFPWGVFTAGVPLTTKCDVSYDVTSASPEAGPSMKFR